MQDIRDIIFKGIGERRFAATLSCERAGVLAGLDDARRRAGELGIELSFGPQEGAQVAAGEALASVTATPKAMAQAEEVIIGSLAKASGIATAARKACAHAGGTRVVSGSWKKMPPETKQLVRHAVCVGGASFRIVDGPMAYLDKNFIRMLGSITAALEACAGLSGHALVVQIRNEAGGVAAETREAVAGGADVLMVDTGQLDDLASCEAELARLGARGRVRLAFAGNVRIADVDALAGRVDAICIGKEIVDAPLLDMKLDVVGREG